MPRRVLVVDDEAPIREMLAFALSQADFEVSEAGTVAETVSSLQDKLPDLILLDWMLPDGSGVRLAQKLKADEQYREVPIIMVTARGEEEDKIKGLEVGADDYVTKPFSPRELLARINAVMRRASPLNGEDAIEVEGLKLDPIAHRVTSVNEPLDMGPTEFRLLHFFMTHPERVYSRSQLLDYVWGTNVFVEERTVDVHIRRLRKAITGHGHERLIQTVRGAGYRFSAKVN
ncbi:phosphate regulon transcriptional regulatory protein PhoB [Pelagibaculum spongiae]|uniref:Phosphate regulon transcriptional regulatory protein PhoB n=2 Tax=Pelagibaculum spongiae TaxID=2080658 RepID=A0A2V1GYG6_9GAMM|nr:phosphate regulon transcriptional regulator PhoB [Pelagibaculum spongiae]PVZ69685.1 phosphate regulon transcriptional regulatory protein PhoB [Pelagibaculum spongiae]